MRPHASFRLSSSLVVVVATASCTQMRASDDVAEWIRLFDGETLDGWTPKIRGHAVGEDPYDTFRVDEGLLKVRYDRYETFEGRFGHLFFEGVHSHYRLRVEYRFVGLQCPGGPGWAFRNSGVMIHGQAPDTMDVDQEFPVSIEVQLLGGHGKESRPTANLCTPGTHVVMDGALEKRHCTSSRSRTFHGTQWVTVEIEVHGNDLVRHLVNGEVVLEYEQPQLDPDDPDAAKLVGDGTLLLREGSISLQSESHPVEFKRIELSLLSE